MALSIVFSFRHEDEKYFRTPLHFNEGPSKNQPERTVSEDPS